MLPHSIQPPGEARLDALGQRRQVAPPRRGVRWWGPPLGVWGPPLGASPAVHSALRASSSASFSLHVASRSSVPPLLACAVGMRLLPSGAAWGTFLTGSKRVCPLRV